jgi:hypothetical protein
MYPKNGWEKNILILIICVAFGIIYSSTALCQYWVAMPPYNTLWPLWSQVLSPMDPTTGLLTPIVGSLEPNIMLPVQPALTWNPALPYPWLLYNTPIGMIYYDVMFGINMWPHSSLIDPMTGGPLPIMLPANFSSLPPTDSTWILNTVPVANDFYQASYPYYNFLGTLSLPAIINLPPITPLSLDQYLAMFPITTPSAIPSVLSATAILGF